jgi:hypothetical protein
MEKGNEVYMTPEQERLVTSVMAKIPDARQRIVSQLMSEDASIPAYSQSSYIDILVLCIYSDTLAWIRFAVSGTDDAHLGIQTGERLFITNLKMGHSSGRISLLQSVPNTSWKCLSRKQHSIDGSPLQVEVSLREASTRGAHAEITVRCYVIDWWVDDETSEIANLIIVATDPSRVVLRLSYPVPYMLKSKLSWLQMGSEVIISCALIQNFDELHDILQCMRSEHTLVSAVDVRSRCLPVDRFTLEAFEEDKRRFKALTQGKTYFLSVTQIGCVESCAREHLTMVSVACEEPHNGSGMRRITVTNSLPSLCLLISEKLLLSCVQTGTADLVLCDLWTISRLSWNISGAVHLQKEVVWIEVKDKRAETLKLLLNGLTGK